MYGGDKPTGSGEVTGIDDISSGARSVVPTPDAQETSGNDAGSVEPTPDAQETSGNDAGSVEPTPDAQETP